MKAIKKILATVMCLCLVFGCVAITAGAADTGSITIQNPANSDATVAGKTFNVYKVFNATTNGNSTSYSWYTYTDDGGNTVTPFYDFFYGADGVLGQKADGKVQAAVDHITKIHTEQDNLALSQFAEKMHQYIENANKTTVTIKPIVDPVEAGDTATSVSVTGLGYGYYLVYDATDLSSNASAVRSAVMLTTVNKDVVVTLKANRPEIEKTVLENDGVTYGNGTSSMIGETVTFKITTYVPSHALYTTYKYFINDNMHDGLTLKADTIKVYLDDTTLLVQDENYKLSLPGDDGAEFKVDFTDFMDEFETDDKLTIVYDAVVTNGINAQKASPNVATLTYSNDPTKDDSIGTASDDANIYSYQFVFTKYAQDASGVFTNVRLAGAEFKMYKVNTDGSEELIKFTTAPGTNSEGAQFTKYIVAADDAADTTDTLVVHNEGQPTIQLNHLNYGGHLGDVFIFGLSEGKYKLVETKAPDGYVLPDTPFEINIIDEIGIMGSVGTLKVTGSHTGSGSIVNMNGMAEQILTVWAEITNKPGSVLPDTGGMGTTIFTVVGIILMAGAIAFFTSRKRSSAA